MARIVVIEDHADTRELLEVILRAAGHEVVTAADGDEGLAAIARWEANLVVTDLFMPNRDGFETIMRLRNSSPHIAILAISGGAKVARAESYLGAAREIGADAVLPKPFDPDRLVALVAELLLLRAAR